MLCVYVQYGTGKNLETRASFSSLKRSLVMFLYILNLIGNKKMQLTLIFWCFNKLNDCAFQLKKNILWLTRSKVMALKSRREIVAGNGMWLTHPSHLG